MGISPSPDGRLLGFPSNGKIPRRDTSPPTGAGLRDFWTLLAVTTQSLTFLVELASGALAGSLTEGDSASELICGWTLVSLVDFTSLLVLLTVTSRLLAELSICNGGYRGCSVEWLVTLCMAGWPAGPGLPAAFCSSAGLEPGLAFLNSRNVWDVDLVEMVTEGVGSAEGLEEQAGLEEVGVTWSLLGTTAATRPAGAGLLVLEEPMGPTICMGREEGVDACPTLILSLGKIWRKVAEESMEEMEEAAIMGAALPWGLLATMGGVAEEEEEGEGRMELWRLARLEFGWR